jgi:superfamily II DNA/RNA helicase
MSRPVPHHPDDYVHRIGRTGRAGKSGTAITIVGPSDGKAVAAIEALTGQPIAWAGEPPRVEAPEEARPAPSDEHRGRRDQHRRGRNSRNEQRGPRKQNGGNPNHSAPAGAPPRLYL